MIRTIRLLLPTLLVLPGVAFAHQINGTVRLPNGQPVQDEIAIDCPAMRFSDQKRTDRNGSFSFFVRDTGRCELRLGGASYPVYSGQNPVRYDLVFDPGRRALRRR